MTVREFVSELLDASGSGEVGLDTKLYFVLPDADDIPAGCACSIAGFFYDAENNHLYFETITN